MKARLIFYIRKIEKSAKSSSEFICGSASKFICILYPYKAISRTSSHLILDFLNSISQSFFFISNYFFEICIGRFLVYFFLSSNIWGNTVDYFTENLQIYDYPAIALICNHTFFWNQFIHIHVSVKNDKKMDFLIPSHMTSDF